MRLEEWQSWLDSQFLDQPVHGPKPDQISAIEPLAPQAMIQLTTAAEAAPKASDELSASVTTVTNSLLPEFEEASACTPEAAPPQNQAISTTLKTEPALGAIAPIPSPQTIASSQANQFEDEHMPSIESYLPHLRTQHREPQTTAAIACETKATPGGLIPAELPDAEDVSVPQAICRRGSGLEDASPAEGAVSTNDSVMDTSEAAADSADIVHGEKAASSVQHPSNVSGESSKAAVNQVAPKRARHVRNIRPAELVHEVGPGLLWSLVPKHIQVLVALGSDDVAQNSYKRSFKESRIALIERLLDPTLSLEDTARLLNVCPTTIRRYTNRGLLTHQRTQGDQRRFKLSDVLTFLEAQSSERESNSRASQDL